MTTVIESERDACRLLTEFLNGGDPHALFNVLASDVCYASKHSAAEGCADAYEDLLGDREPGWRVGNLHLGRRTVDCVFQNYGQWTSYYTMRLSAGKIGLVTLYGGTQFRIDGDDLYDEFKVYKGPVKLSELNDGSEMNRMRAELAIALGFPVEDDTAEQLGLIEYFRDPSGRREGDGSRSAFCDARDRSVWELGQFAARDWRKRRILDALTILAELGVTYDDLVEIVARAIKRRAK